MVDPGRLRAVLDRIGDEVAALSRLGARGTELLADDDLMAAVKYRFVVAIEACIDAGEHIIASEGLRSATSFADVFTVLGEAEMLAGELVPELARMARFRNLLVHQYAEIDDERVLELVETRLGDFDDFRAAVARVALEES